MSSFLVGSGGDSEALEETLSSASSSLRLRTLCCPPSPRPGAREEDLVLLKLLPRPPALAGSTPGSCLGHLTAPRVQGEGWGRVPIGGVQPSLMLSHQEGRECHARLLAPARAQCYFTHN